MSAIFINYRREETQAVAGRLADQLSAAFGRENIFRDVTSMKSRLGRNFAREIADVIARCDVFLVLIGPRWLEILRQRQRDPQDFVVFEIEEALKRSDVLVVPVLVEGASMPDAQALPTGLRNLSFLQALDLTDRYWEQSVGELIDALIDRFGLGPVDEARLPEPGLPNLVEIVPGLWRFQFQNPMGIPGQLDVQFLPTGTFQGQLFLPAGAAAVNGYWQIAPNGGLVLQGQQTIGWQTLPYATQLQFSQILPTYLSGWSVGGEQFAAQRMG